MILTSRLEILNKSFSRCGARLWNVIPPEIRKLKKNYFKSELRELVFKMLVSEDEYINSSIFVDRLVSSLYFPLVKTGQRILDF